MAFDGQRALADAIVAHQKRAQTSNALARADNAQRQKDFFNRSRPITNAGIELAADSDRIETEPITGQKRGR